MRPLEAQNSPARALTPSMSSRGCARTSMLATFRSRSDRAHGLHPFAVLRFARTSRAVLQSRNLMSALYQRFNLSADAPVSCGRSR